MPPPHRQVTAQPDRLELLIFAEGAVTEEVYLKHWHRRFRMKINLEVHEFRGTPMALVERAVSAKATGQREQKRGRGRAHDQVWCVFDVDEHPFLPEARDLAAKNDVRLAISNPCIELWFLLHFVQQTAYIDRHTAQGQAFDHLRCGKSLNPEALTALEDRFDTAKDRAVHLEEKHRGDGTPSPGNPSSGMWRLIDEFLSI